MTDYIKKLIDKSRDKRDEMKRSEMIVFRVTPYERDLLIDTYGTMAGIRDFALASTDTNLVDEVIEDTEDAED